MEYIFYSVHLYTWKLYLILLDFNLTKRVEGVVDDKGQGNHMTCAPFVNLVSRMKNLKASPLNENYNHA